MIDDNIDAWVAQMQRSVATLMEPTTLRFECRDGCGLILRLRPIDCPFDGSPFCPKCGKRLLV